MCALTNGRRAADLGTMGLRKAEPQNESYTPDARYTQVAFHLISGNARWKDAE
jgi:hypothetical protein